MKYLATTLTIISILSLSILAGCSGNGDATIEPVRSTGSGDSSGNAESGEHDEGSASGEHDEGSASGEHDEGSASGEHDEGSASGEHNEGSESGEGDEESSVQYALDDIYDEVRAGARLIVSYDRGSNTFTGTVENVTSGTLMRVRVEVHLSNGIELGPTTPVDLSPGEVAGVTLEASSKPFATWSAHPEVG